MGVYGFCSECPLSLPSRGSLSLGEVICHIVSGPSGTVHVVSSIGFCLKASEKSSLANTSANELEVDFPLSPILKSLQLWLTAGLQSHDIN